MSKKQSSTPHDALFKLFYANRRRHASMALLELIQNIFVNAI